MNIQEIKDTINYLLDNNLKLVEKGQNKLSICIEGPCGVGKTSIVKQIAEERGAGYKRLNISELEEVGDLCGIPQKTYLMLKGDEEKRVVEKSVPQFVQLGYTLCPDCDPVMTYAIPEWVPTDENQEFILFLDDFSRGSQLFMQAIMSLIQFGEYVSWKLPKKCHLILSSNPDNSTYSVTSLDPAQKSRLINFNVEFDHKLFAKWMEGMGMKDSLINFVLMTPEMFTRNEVINARSYTMFANALEGIKDLGSVDGLQMVSLIAKGCFGDDGDYISSLLVQFINNNLDKLITPEEMLKGEWEETCRKMEKNLFKNDRYRADIGSMLTLRFINYIEFYFEKEKDTKKSEKVMNRIIEIVSYKKDNQCLLTEDLIYKLLKTINSKYPSRFVKIFNNPVIRQKLFL